MANMANNKASPRKDLYYPANTPANTSTNNQMLSREEKRKQNLASLAHLENKDKYDQNTECELSAAIDILSDEEIFDKSSPNFSYGKTIS